MTQPNEKLQTSIDTKQLFEKINTEYGEDIQQSIFRPALEYIVNSLIEFELTKYINAERHERTQNRKTQRNGKRERKTALKTSSGPIPIQIPKIRKGSFFPSILERYQRIERALIGVIQEAYIHGVSTRPMEKLFRSLGLEGLDKSTVSRMIQPLLDQVRSWKSRRLNEEYVYIWVDAIVLRVRYEGCVQRVSVAVAMGLQADGHLDILGFYQGRQESYVNWKDLFQNLKDRGLARSGLWISDAHDGLLKAFEECFPGQLHQRCIVHWQRNLMTKVKPSDRKWIAGLSRRVIKSGSAEEFRQNWNELITKVSNSKYSTLLDWLDETKEEVSAYLSYPESHYPKIRSTNRIERCNEEIRRRDRVIRIYPSTSSCELLVGCILMDESEKMMERKYISTGLTEAIRFMKKRKMLNQTKNLKSVV